MAATGRQREASPSHWATDARCLPLRPDLVLLLAVNALIGSAHGSTTAAGTAFDAQASPVKYALRGCRCARHEIVSFDLKRQTAAMSIRASGSQLSWVITRVVLR